MDHLFRVQQRLALQDPEGKLVQKELARALIRSGRKTEAYKIYRQSGLLAEDDPEARALVTEMTQEQRGILKGCPDRWLGDSSFPNYPTAHSPALYKILDTHQFIDSLSIKDVITDEILDHVASIPHILALRLTDKRFRGDLTKLKRSKIERLKLGTINPKRSPPFSLGELTQLRALALETQRLNPSLAGLIVQLKGLENLSLKVLKGELNALRQIKEKPLHSLTVNALNLRDEDLRILGASGALKELEMTGGSFTQGGLEDLCQATSLTNLSFADHRSLGQGDLSCLSQLTNLEALTFRRCRFRETQLELLGELPKLKALSITQNRRIGDGIFDVLKDLQHLESLDLSGCQISDVGIAKLRTLSSLRTLFLGDCNITVDGLQALADLPQLDVLLWDHQVYFRETDLPLSEYLAGLPQAS